MPSRYRFMVIDRLGTDLQKKFEECGRRFPRKLVLQLGLRLVGYFMIKRFQFTCIFSAELPSSGKQQVEGILVVFPLLLPRRAASPLWDPAPPERNKIFYLCYVVNSSLLDIYAQRPLL